MQSDEQKEKVRLIREERKKFREVTEEVRENHRNHREKYERAREPLLQGLATQFDLKLFREAQARACEVLVRYCGVIIDNQGGPGQSL